MGTDRPRQIFVGSPTEVRINYRNAKTKVPFLAVTGGTLKIFDDIDETQALLATLNLAEDVSIPGDYVATVPFDQSGLVDGATGRFLIEISAASGFEVKLQGRCSFITLTDTGL